ncbi:MAG: hypothetical protein OEU46_18720 [Alphaproteobacteria bacterium]|nr:hypothetical protein [Alphaproteobacteria bacterium]
MFKVGDTVRHVGRNIVGVVVETDGDTVYFEQSNGAEVDFAASALVLESAFQAQHDTAVRDDAGSREYDGVYDAVLSNLYPAIVALGQQTHAQIERIPGVAAKSWDALSSLQKLNAISTATDLPVKTWIESNQPGAKPAIGPLQLSILAKLGKKA